MLFSHIVFICHLQWRRYFLFSVENIFEAFSPAGFFLPHPVRLRVTRVFVKQTLFSGAAWKWDLHVVTTLHELLALKVTELLWVTHLHSNEILTGLFHFILLYPAVDQKEGTIPYPSTLSMLLNHCCVRDARLLSCMCI